MIFKSTRRWSVVSLPQKALERHLTYLNSVDEADLPSIIGEHFTKAAALGRSRKSGAWAEASFHRDKAKLAILYKDGLRLNPTTLKEEV